MRILGPFTGTEFNESYSGFGNTTDTSTTTITTSRRTRRQPTFTFSTRGPLSPVEEFFIGNCKTHYVHEKKNYIYKTVWRLINIYIYDKYCTQFKNARIIFIYL